MIRREKKGKTLILTMEGEDLHNYLNEDLIKDLRRHLAFAELDPEIQCVILTGSGGCFCSGISPANMTSASGTEETEGVLMDCYRSLLQQIIRLPHLFITLINGKATGIGATLALTGDHVYMTKKGSFDFPSLQSELAAEEELNCLVEEFYRKRRTLRLKRCFPVLQSSVKRLGKYIFGGELPSIRKQGTLILNQ